ncbi:MAG: DcrB-related protein [Candidatus Obscuribacterales bacterium]|nr:DcrB-related protein [Candidatus Obscuribacterales bacterium]
MRRNFCTLSILLPAIFVVSNELIQPSLCDARTGRERLPQLNSSWQSSRYSASGLSIAYPFRWQVSEKPDKDTIVKMTGTLSDGVPAEIALKLSDTKGVSAETLSKFFAEAYLNKLPNYKSISDRDISFGDGWHIEGIDKQISFDTNGTPFRQRYVFFDGPMGVMILTFSAPTKGFDSLQPICDQVIMSIKKEQTQNLASGSSYNSKPQTSVPKPEAWSFESLQAPSSPLTFSYPKGWQVETHADKDHPLSIHGADSLGKPGYIEIYSGVAPPTVTLEALASSLEEKYFAGLKDYRRIKQEPVSCGSMNNLQGIVHEMTFLEGAQPIKQMCLFFAQDGRLYSFTLGCPGWKDNDVRTLFHKMVATIKVPQT